MAVLIGIDEAGYGPVIGPLVVAAAAFSLPEEVLVGRADLWKVLRGAVARNRARSAGRVVVADSKKLHNSKDGYKYLARGVLAALAANGEGRPVRLGELLAGLEAVEDGGLGVYPWYCGVDGCELVCDAGDVTVAGAGLRRELAAKGMALAGLRARVLPAGRYNELVAATGNKAMVLWQVVCQLIDWGWRRFGGENLQVVVDQQSGRVRYMEGLGRMFPGMAMRILREEAGVSSYELKGPRGGMRVHFLTKGETRQLPIALASMTAKYVRELLMEQLNGWFGEQVAGLAPTAGYYTDGMRWLGEVRAAAVAGVREDLLVRVK